MKAFTLVFLAIHSTCVLSAAAFQNLGFEKARLPQKPVPGESLAISAALPGWGIDLAEAPQGVVSYNDMALSSASATLWDHGESTTYPFQGRFHAQISAGELRNPPSTDFIYGSSSLYQSGDIPTDAKSLLFTAVIGNRRNLEVDLNGQALHLVALGGDALLTRFGADLSGWEGKTAELRFTIHPEEQSRFGSVQLDDISFSIASIPEPSTYVLLATGTLLLGAAVQRRR